MRQRGGLHSSAEGENVQWASGRDVTQAQEEIAIGQAEGVRGHGAS